MFTGIIEELGRVRSIDRRGEDARIVIKAHTVTEDAQDGDSIAVNGVCLTALSVNKDSFAADVSRETMQRSTLGRVLLGAPVNLERAVTPATRLGGHIVQGHVDARGTFLGATDHGGDIPGGDRPRRLLDCAHRLSPGDWPVPGFQRLGRGRGRQPHDCGANRRLFRDRRYSQDVGTHKLLSSPAQR